MNLISINDIPSWFTILTITIFSAIVGSFLSFLSYRMVYEKDILDVHSRCPKCLNKLTVMELIPVFSWLFLRGRCKHCEARVSIRYILIEISAIIVGISGYYLYGISIETVIWLLLGYIFLFMLITDFEHLIVLDSAQIAFLTVFFIYSYLKNIPIFVNIYSFAALSTGILGLKYGYIKFRKKDALGWADIKFIMIAALFMPLEKIHEFLFIAGLSGVIIGLIWQKVTKLKVFPFIPSLIFAFLFVMRDIL